jgi:hypothetical protein
MLPGSGIIDNVQVNNANGGVHTNVTVVGNNSSIENVQGVVGELPLQYSILPMHLRGESNQSVAAAIEMPIMIDNQQVGIMRYYPTPTGGVANNEVRLIMDRQYNVDVSISTDGALQFSHNGSTVGMMLPPNGATLDVRVTSTNGDVSFVGNDEDRRVRRICHGNSTLTVPSSDPGTGLPASSQLRTKAAPPGSMTNNDLLRAASIVTTQADIDSLIAQSEGNPDVFVELLARRTEIIATVGNPTTTRGQNATVSEPSLQLLTTCVSNGTPTAGATQLLETASGIVNETVNTVTTFGSSLLESAASLCRPQTFAVMNNSVVTAQTVGGGTLGTTGYTV